MFAIANPGILAAGSQGVSREDFEAHLLALAANERSWSWSSAWSTGLFRVPVLNADEGAMRGSPWLEVFRGATSSSTTCRVVQHSLPSYAEYVSQKSAERLILLDVLSDGGGFFAFNSVSRNNYGSLSTSPSGGKFKIIRCLYWSEELGRPMQTNPATGGGPTPYNWSA